MIIVFFVLLIAASITYLLTILGPSISWLIIVWVLIGLIGGILAIIIFFILTSFVVKRTKPFGKFKHFIARQISDFVLFCLRIKIVEVLGKENIPKTNFVMYANHKSNTDPFILVSSIRRSVGYAAKSGVYKLPFVRSWLTGIGSININRDNDREAIKEILRGINLIERGASLGIFPEGGIKSRTNPLMVDVKPGAYKLATKPGVPILPVAIIGSINVKNNAPWKKTKIKVVIGNPLLKNDYEDYSTVEIGEIMFNKINKMIEENLPK